MKSKKCIFKVLLIIAAVFVMFLIEMPKAYAASYSADYRYWDQGASDDYTMTQKGCFVTSQAKLLYATGIERSVGFNPDVYLSWERKTGYINQNFYQTSTWAAPVAYASYVGRELEYLGEWPATDEQLWFNINAGYHTIIKLNGGNHYAYLDNELSRLYGQLYIDDSSPGKPRPLTSYSYRDCGYVYRMKAVQPTSIQNLGDNFYAFIKSENGFYNADRNSDIVLENYNCDSKIVWNFIRQSDETYVIKNVGTGLYLDICNSNDYDGGLIKTFSYNGSTAQKYYIYGSENGYIIRPQCSPNRVVTVDGGGNVIGHKLNMWQYYDNCLTQIFKIQKVYPVTNSNLTYKNNSGKVTFNWSSASNAEKYNLIIKTGKKGSVKDYKKAMGLTSTSYSLTMPNGYYEVYVEAVNALDSKKSNVLAFNVSNSMPFKDVKTSDWFYNAVEFAYKNKMMSGYNNTTFAPNDKVTRGMIVTILYKMEGSPNVSGKSKFSDVKSTEYYAKAVKWATDKGIVKGYAGTNKFGPDDNIIRQDLAGILRNYAKYKKKNVNVTSNLKKFKDYKKVDSYANTAMQWAVGKGVITGNSDGTLNPKGTATRAEAAAMIQKYCNKVGR